MHGLLRCNINACVPAHAQAERTCHSEMSQLPEMGNGASKCKWHHAPEARWGFWEFWRESSWELDTEREELTFACSRRPWAGVARDRGGRWKSRNRKNVYLFPYVEEPLNSKVIKSFVPELRSRKCFSCFEILCSMYICNEHPMYISHIHVYGYGTL